MVVGGWLLVVRWVAGLLGPSLALALTVALALPAFGHGSWSNFSSA